MLSLPAVALPRSLAYSLLALVALACAGKTKPGNEAAAANEGDDASKRAGPRSTSPETTGAGEPVAVVELDIGEARPCERMCGRISDCLLSDEGRDAAEAAGVEFACLDTCVYADPEQPAGPAFQACDQTSTCGELLGCARGRWDAALAARKPVEIAAPITAIRDTCESACLALQSCNWFYRMPDQIDGMAGTEFQTSVNACTEGCRFMEQTYTPYAECVGEANCEQFYQCASRLYP